MDDDARDLLERFRAATSSAPDDPTRRAIWRALQRRSAGPRTVVDPAWRRAALLGVALAAALALVWALARGTAETRRHAASPAMDEAVDRHAPSNTAGDAGTRAVARTPAEVTASPITAPASPTARAVADPPLQRPAATQRPPTPVVPADPAVQRPDADVLAREAKLLHDARSAALRGDRAAAEAALDRHARDFPRGALAPERWVLRVELACAAADATAARREAARFAADYPGAAAAITLRERPCD